MHDLHLIENMRDLKAAMKFVAKKLIERENIEHGEQLAGAAAMLQTWIDGIQEEFNLSQNKE